MSRSLVEGSGATVILTWPAVDDSHPDHDLIELCAEWRRILTKIDHFAAIADKCYEVAVGKYPEKPEPLAERDKYQAACQAIEDECGVTAANQKVDALQEEQLPLEKRIQETHAVTVDGVLAKLLIPAVIWHPEPPTYDQCDSTDERLMVSAALDVSRFASDALPPAPSSVQHPDAELIVLGRQLREMRDEWNAAAKDTDEAADEATEKYDDPLTKIEDAIIGIPARSLSGVLSKLRVVAGDESRLSPSNNTRALWGAFDDAERLAGHGEVTSVVAPVAVVPQDQPVPTDDDALFAKLREVEALKAKSRDLGNGPESEAVMDQALDVENELADIPAHTPAGAAAKLGVALHYQAGRNDMTDQLVASAKADLDRQAGITTDIAAAVSALAPPAAQLADDPDFGPVTSEIVGLGREARGHTFKLAKLAILADQYERGGPAEPFFEACSEYAETDRWGAFRIMQLAPGAGSGKRQGGAS